MATGKRLKAQINEAEPIVTPGKTDESPAWEMIENGRYRPRRIRGSFHGRELG